MPAQPIAFSGIASISGGNTANQRRVAFATLGCKVNLYDTEAVAECFRQRGYQVVNFSDHAEVYVINTCSVTNMGARKSRQVIRRAIKRNPQAVIVAMGCYTQYAPDEVGALDGVDVLVGTNRKAEIVDLVEEAVHGVNPINVVGKIMSERKFEEVEALHFEGRTRAVLKVQDGCNEFCSYCQIPWARGRNRSRQPERVIEQVYSLSDQEFKEIVLTGVHLGTYGEDLIPPTTLSDLMRSVVQVRGIERVRLSSIDPNEITPALLDVMAAYPGICRHLHIPAQSGEDSILNAMRRRNTTAEYRNLVSTLREKLPGVAITTDVIVGFPGESDESFLQTLQFCREMAFHKIHVFPYSRRKGTKADQMPGHLPDEVKQKRAHELIKLSEEMALAHHTALVGKEVIVLVEGASDKGREYVQGLTDTYVRVHVSGEGEQLDGMLPVQVTQAFTDCVIATPIMRKNVSTS